MKMKQFTTLNSTRIAVDRYNIHYLEQVNEQTCLLHYSLGENEFEVHVMGDFDELLKMINDPEIDDNEGDEWKE